MKTKLVDTVVGNEEFVRMRIYDGDLQINEAAEELLRLERCQRQAERILFDTRLKEAHKIISLLKTKEKEMNEETNLPVVEAPALSDLEQHLDAETKALEADKTAQLKTEFVQVEDEEPVA